MWKASKEPKKGGAGGGYTWGKPGKQDLVEVQNARDDPAYNSEDEDNVVLHSVDVHEKDLCDEGEKTEHKKDVIKKLKKSKSLSAPYDGLGFFPEDFNLKEFVIYIRENVEEFLKSGDRKPIVEKFQFPDLIKVHSYVTARIFQVMVEKSPSQREQLIHLLQKMPYITPASIRRGLDRVYWSLPDLMIDVPDAPDILKEVLTGLISEKLVPQEIVSRVPLLVVKCLKEPRFTDIAEDFDLSIAHPQEKEKAATLARELLRTRDSAEVIKYYNSSETSKLFKSYFVKKLIEISFDGKSEDKNFACRFLKEQEDSGFITNASIKYALDDLVWNLKDLSVDIPDVSSMLAKFIARLVAEETITASYIFESELSQPELGDDNIESYCLHEAYNLKDQNSFLESLDGIWGALTTIESLKEVIKNNIEEFLVSGDEQEGIKLFRRLKCPYYMHEFVKRVLTVAVERDDGGRQKALRLLQVMCEQLLVSKTQLQLGMKRFEESIKDLALDVPQAQTIYEQVRGEMTKMKIVDKF